MLHLIKRIIKEQLDEALRDEIPDYMISAVKKNNPNVADKFLDMDVPKHTELIPNLKLEINEPNLKNRFIKEIQNHFSKSILEQFHKTKLYEIFSKNQNILLALFKGVDDILIYEIFSKNNVKIDIIDKLKILYSKEFLLLQGKGNPDVITKFYTFNPIFSKNKSNIFGFIKSFNIAFPKYKIDLNPIINDRVFQGLREPIMNYEKNVMDLANTKLYLYITDKPADILRMSVSNFYSSCQNLYSGSYNEKLLSNVFDENSKIAYLIFDSPYVDNQGNKHPFTPISRTIIRIGRDNKVLFDKNYPSEMEDDFHNIIEKYTQLKNQGTANSIYDYKNVGLPAPYMDKFKIKSTGGESELENNPRAVALADEFNFDIAELEQESDNIFNYDGKRYVVYTEEEADEYTRDYMRDSWTEYVADSQNFYNLVTSGVLIKDRVYSTLGIDDDYLDEQGMNFEEFLENMGIESLYDFNENIRKNGYSNYWNWYREGVTFNLDAVIRYFGGMNEVRNFAIASYDGRENYNDGYLIYRLD
jgi:hypothetical protein